MSLLHNRRRRVQPSRTNVVQTKGGFLPVPQTAEEDERVLSRRAGEDVPPGVYGEVGFEGLGCSRSRFHRAEVVKVVLPVERRGVALGSNGADELVGVREELSAGDGRNY